MDYAIYSYDGTADNFILIANFSFYQNAVEFKSIWTERGINNYYLYEKKHSSQVFPLKESRYVLDSEFKQRK